MSSSEAGERVRLAQPPPDPIFEIAKQLGELTATVARIADLERRSTQFGLELQRAQGELETLRQKVAELAQAESRSARTPPTAQIQTKWEFLYRSRAFTWIFGVLVAALATLGLGDVFDLLASWVKSRP